MEITEQATSENIKNPVGICGIAFIEFTGPDADYFHRIFQSLGMSKMKKHRTRNIYHYQQHDIHFLLNLDEAGFARYFREAHGPSVCGLGFRTVNGEAGYHTALQRGAKAFDPQVHGEKSLTLPATWGVGESLIYYVQTDEGKGDGFLDEFDPLPETELKANRVESKGFLCVDHLTNNVYPGTRDQWTHFYKTIYGFTEVRYFDIQGEETGLTSFALKSPCQTFCIPINEGTEEKSQINEYLREYNGPGVQHIALMTPDILDTLDKLTGIQTLDIDAEYYTEAFQRVPQVTEDRDRIRQHQVLIDGDAQGYLLQIFTQNLFGPIFFEFIQRKNHGGFGEGNFTALFRSIERDQRARGVL